MTSSELADRRCTPCQGGVLPLKGAPLADLIGHGTRPCCDTFFQSSKHAASTQKAGVGACKVSSCAHQ